MTSTFSQPLLYSNLLKMDKVHMLRFAQGPKLKRTEVAMVIGFGLAVGLVLGYILMGTAHAIFDIGAQEHYQHDGR